MRDSTKPASRSTRRCFETDGCGNRSSRSMSPTERSDESSKLRMARLLGSATTANDVSTTCIYLIGHMPVKAYCKLDSASERRRALERLALFRAEHRVRVSARCSERGCRARAECHRDHQ